MGPAPLARPLRLRDAGAEVVEQFLEAALLDGLSVIVCRPILAVRLFLFKGDRLGFYDGAVRPGFAPDDDLDGPDVLADEAAFGTIGTVAFLGRKIDRVFLFPRRLRRHQELAAVLLFDAAHGRDHDGSLLARIKRHGCFPLG
jgi:hypothetical protein